MHQPAAPSHCENCDADLQGGYCHRCGQSAANPIRHAGHAIEEFFEAFWHLDGRVFRTLRELLAPGKVARNYLAGHRQRYIAPLRLFVILSLLTFFIGKLTIQVDANWIDTDIATAGADLDAITNSRTEEEVRRNRDRLLADIEQARETGDKPAPGVDAALLAAQIQIRGEAGNRIAELRSADEASANTEDPAPEDATAAAPQSQGSVFTSGLDAWNPQADPVRIGWLPDFANRWATRKMIQGRDNIERMEGRPDLWLQAFMGSVPSALFLLVPVFALMLKLAYLFKRRLYLEHMVVALYSHIFLLLALLSMFVLAALHNWIEPHVAWLARGVDLVRIGIFLWMPVYLLLMQKRVYGQGWPMTLLKYLVIGNLYISLLSFTTAIMFLATLVQT